MSPAAAGISDAWSHVTAEIPPNGLQANLEATAEECRLLAAELGILAVDRLRFQYRIGPVSGGRYRLEGLLQASVVQACVVTLDPVPAVIEDRIGVEFRPDPVHETPGRLGEELPALEAEEYEPIEQNRLAIGRVVVETLLAALPPYPRAPGAELESREAGPSEPGATSPFAALADWKARKEE